MQNIKKNPDYNLDSYYSLLILVDLNAALSELISHIHTHRHRLMRGIHSPVELGQWPSVLQRH